MDGGLSAFNNLTQCTSCVSLDLQKPIQVPEQSAQPYQCQTIHPQPIRNIIPFVVGNMEGIQPLLGSYNNVERVNNYVSVDSWKNFVGVVVGNTEGDGGKKESLWHRMKWTERMVKLLITAASYFKVDTFPECSSITKSSVVSSKKGKWRAISMIMVERGYNVSPQQCEDKFNDLNKKYKRLNDILGRGTSCKVVENHDILDLMDLSDELKEEVRKILGSRHLFYREMCSYHNGNRLFLPHDLALQRSVQLTLNGKENHEFHKVLPPMPKRKNKDEENELLASHDTLVFSGCNMQSDSHMPKDPTNVNHVLIKNRKGEKLQDQWIFSHKCPLEEQRLQIRAQMLELEIKQFKWRIASQQEEWKLLKMKLENKCMKLENERLALKLRSGEAADLN